MKGSLITTASLVAVAILMSPCGQVCGQAGGHLRAHKHAPHGLTLDDVLRSDRVLDVRITVAARDWHELRHQSRSMSAAGHAQRRHAPIESPFTYFDARVTIDGVEFPRVGIRKKGFIGSLSSTRPSLKIKLNHVDDKGAIEGLTNLTLNNNKQDRSLVSQCLSYALFNAAGSPAPRCGFARVTVNGENLGVYSHVETMRAPLLERGFGDAGGTLYEGMAIDFFAGWAGGFERKCGADRPGRDQINRLIDALQARTSGLDCEQAIGELVDLDAFYVFWALEGLLGCWDGYSGNRNNYFVYLDPRTERFHFLPWGADSLFRTSRPFRRNPTAPISVKTVGLIAHRLYQLDSGRRRYRKTLEGLLADHWDEAALLAETHRLEAMLAPHLSPEQADSAESLDRVRRFIRSRRADIGGEIAGGMPRWNRPPAPPHGLDQGGRDEQERSGSIWEAAACGDLEAIRLHVGRGISVDAANEDGSLPLAIAAIAGHTEAVRYLLQVGAAVNACSSDDQVALHGAAFMGHVDVVELLIEHDADKDAVNKALATPLDNAAEEWTQDIEERVEFISSWLRVEFEPRTVEANRREAAALLRQHGARRARQILRKAGGGLWGAVRAGDLSAMQESLASGADPNARDSSGITALSLAAAGGHSKAVALLIERGAKVDAGNRDGASPLHLAALLGRLTTVELLLEKQADVNARDEHGETPLGIVAADWSGHVQQATERMARMLKLEADLAAIRKARPKVAAILRERGGRTGDEMR